MTAIEAVRQLRAYLCDSQQAFATRLGLSISAIANYEKDRGPTGKSLVSLAKLAAETGRQDISDVFLAELASDLGVTVEAARRMFGERRVIRCDICKAAMDVTSNTAAKRVHDRCSRNERQKKWLARKRAASA